MAIGDLGNINQHAQFTVKQILEALTRADFEKWYETKFMDFITGEETAPTKNEILEQLYQLLK